MPMTTGENIIIREARPADVADLARLRWDFRVEGQPCASRGDFLTECEAWLRDALASRRWIVAVAESRPAALCGCMFLQCVEKVPAPGATRRAWGYVTNSFVDSQLQNRGVGQKLLQLLIAAARNRGPGVPDRVAWCSGCPVLSARRISFSVRRARRSR